MSEQETAKSRTIAQINAMVRGIVEVETLGHMYWVGGKVDRFHKSGLGHIYFNLIDERKSISCMLPESQQGHIEFEIKNNIEIEVLGDIQVYEDRAEVQIQVINARLVENNGISTLTGIQQLKHDGLYPKESTPVPQPIRKIGIVTSQSSRAVGDFETTYQIEGQTTVLAPIQWQYVMLEGQRAVESIIDGIEKLSRNADIDIIAIIRGGGRYSNLAVFDNVDIARTIAKSPKYIITGIGHHKDSTLADQVSDYAASTPTSVANYIAKLCLQSKSPMENSIEASSTYNIILMVVIAVMFIIIVLLLLLNFQ